MATAEQKKRAERYFVEHVQQHIPDTCQQPHPKRIRGARLPVRHAGRRRRRGGHALFHTAAPGLFPELQVAQFHRDIVVRAGETTTGNSVPRWM